MVLPTSIPNFTDHIISFRSLFLSKGIPSNTTWIAYFSFYVIQLVLAAFIPGMKMYGLPTAPKGERLPYFCNGFLCYYCCVIGALISHFSGFFQLTHIADHVGEYLVASIVIADVTSLMWYCYGIFLNDPHSSYTGNFFYDFFMGTILYPRLGIVDIKMVAECRWSWLTLMLLTLSCALKQYELKGIITAEMGMMLLAHWLYSNATVKGEHCIPCTWDMFHENFGWMLNFWNITGVPFLYCYQSFYILKNTEEVSSYHNIYGIIAIYCLLLIGYYVFDTANAQKASYKLPGIRRNTFPQLPWGVLQEPIKCLHTPKGDLLVDGWYAFARKMQYTGDIVMALSWGLICGFGSFLPYFYFLFFVCFISHRQWRDEIRCRKKYGEHWEKYTKLVPNVFFPHSSFFIWLFTGKKPHLE